MAIQPTVKGVDDVAYETKVVLIAIAEIIRKSADLKEVYQAVEKMANAEGVVLQPYEDNQDKK